MKVQLIVVRGKPEGKVIPLAGPKFKIGRGETCHLRPNSEQVSREHAEFEIESGTVLVRDLGSRNGTLVNGKALTTEAYKLKDRDLVQVGPLTFAVSILDAPAAAAQPTPKPAAAGAAAPSTAQVKPKRVARRHFHRRHRLLAARGKRNPVGRPAHGGLWWRYDHHHRVQRRPGAGPATEQAPLGRR